MNNSDKNIVIKGISVEQSKINYSKSIDKTVIPNETYSSEIEIDVSKSYGNVLVQPKLTYLYNNQEYHMPLNQTIYASVIPEDMLLEILMEKGLIN